MKLSPQDQKITERMQPGVLSSEGFFGTDNRVLGEILQADQSAVEAAETSHEQIAEAMGEILDKAMACYGTPVTVGDSLQARYIEAMGRIPCPFGGEGEVFAKGEIELTDTESGQTVHFTPLSVHMIGKHGFYQGKGSRYRLDPGQLAGMLGLGG
jgi:hypothetical protein